jgi:hypothetical protein
MRHPCQDFNASYNSRGGRVDKICHTTPLRPGIQTTAMKLIFALLVPSLPLTVSAMRSKYYPQRPDTHRPDANRPESHHQDKHPPDQHPHTKQHGIIHSDLPLVYDHTMENNMPHSAHPEMGIRTRVTTVYEGVITTLTVTGLPLRSVTSTIPIPLPLVNDTTLASAAASTPADTFMPIGTSSIDPQDNILPVSTRGGSMVSMATKSQMSSRECFASPTPSASPACLDALPGACQLSTRNIRPVGLAVSRDGRCGKEIGLMCINSKFGSCCGDKGLCGFQETCEAGCQSDAGICANPTNVIPINIHNCFAALQTILEPPKATALRTTCVRNNTLTTTSDQGFVTCLNNNLSICPCRGSLPNECRADRMQTGLACLSVLCPSERERTTTCFVASTLPVRVSGGLESCLRASLRVCG